MAETLIAHESSFYRSLLAGLLDGEHAVVAEVTNGVEAVETARETEPGVVVLAESLPIRDGLEAASDLQETPRPPGVVICTTAQADAQNHAAEPGVNEVVAVPFRRPGLLAAVEHATPP